MDRVKSNLDYQTISDQLDKVLESLQRPDVHVDEAVKLYGQGLKLLDQLEMHLRMAENKLTKLKLKSKTKAEG